MLAYRYPLIAREGWIWIVLAITLASVAYINVGVVSAPLWMLVAVLIFLFRDPSRKIPAIPLGIVCPVDGSIITVEKIFDAYLQRPAICISVKMGFFSVYSVHSPMEGKINKQWLDAPRKIAPLASVKDSTPATNVTASAQWIRSDENDDLVMIMAENTFLPEPQCYAHSGERIGQGQRCGYLRFGTQVDVLVSESTHVDVKVGDKVVGGADIIATLVRQN